jgi:RNA polymerase sigma-70 factor (ECF subfamily)
MPTDASNPDVAGVPEDPALLRDAQRGDLEAFGALVTKYRTRIHAVIAGIIRNDEEAWDVSQDVFLRAWKSLGAFRGGSSFYTWLYRIATNASLDWLRRRRNAPTVPYEDAVAAGDDPVADAAQTAPSRSLDAAEIRQRIGSALDKLSPEHRAVIVLKELEGMQYHEIAEAVGCSIGTVMSRLFYARRRLQSLLKDLHDEL